MVKSNTVSTSHRSAALKAFTILELVVVMAIISVLSAIAVPATAQIMRSNKIEAANSRAYELYTATQNFLTDQQIRNKPLVMKTGGANIVFPVNDTDLATSGYLKDKIIFACHNTSEYLTTSGEKAIPKVTYNSTDDATHGTGDAGIDADTDAILNGIGNYLGGTFKTDEYYWVCQVDSKTYTVDWVICSDEETALNDLKVIMGNYDGSGLYKSVFITDSSTNMAFVSQEHDYNDTSKPSFVGQYPIPFAASK